MSVHPELYKLYEAEKAEAGGESMSEEAYKTYTKNSHKRLTKVKELLNKNEMDLEDLWNLHIVAYFHQHGNNIDDYKKAHEFAKKAVEKGSNMTKWLYAATLDRWLVSQGKLQKNGTQYKRSDNGTYTHLPVDGTITDIQRAEHGIKPLRELQKRRL